ncbi:MAG: class I SAM-dependent methyltransferase, partial [Bacteroidetes bacterium]|nr:class I SAM-dependent methyltransferase [Bacteroidota bacterium]
IHHLDLTAFYMEARRVLVPEGRILFMEPLGHNPIINAYRKLTPGMRTPDEHPLLKKDLIQLSQNFENLNIKYYYFWSLFAIPLRRFKLFKPALRVLDGLDQLMFKWIPGSKNWAWYALLDASNPKPLPQ